MLNIIIISILLCSNVFAIPKLFELKENEEYALLLEETLQYKKSLTNSLRLKNTGMLNYFEGIAQVGLNEFDLGKRLLISALKNRYNKYDIFYYLAQAFMGEDEFSKARFFFKKSYEKGIKPAISLYYAGFTSSKLKDFAKAVKYYKMIDKLSEKESLPVLQAARFQIADIYYEKSKLSKDSLNKVKNIVIPQYEEAFETDPESSLALEIDRKKKSIQKKYELVLFQMRNGRPTARPPFFLRGGLRYGSQSNVDQVVEGQGDPVSSSYADLNLYSRYSYYPSNKYSIAPVFAFNYRNYFSDDEAAKSQSFYLLSAGLDINYEHFLWKLPSTRYIQISYDYLASDVEANSSYEANTRTWNFSLSQEVRYQVGASQLRAGFRQASHYEQLDNSSYNIDFEQVFYFKYLSNFLLLSYSKTAYLEESFSELLDYSSLRLRNDINMPNIFWKLSLGAYASYTRQNFFEDRGQGIVNTTTFGANISFPVSRRLYLSIDMNSSKEKSKETGDVVDNSQYFIGLDFIK